jgi:hypothetical protein
MAFETAVRDDRTNIPIVLQDARRWSGSQNELTPEKRKRHGNNLERLSGHA